MAVRKVLYVEPKEYFSAEMLKAIEEYDREQAEKTKAAQKPAEQEAPEE